MTDRKTTQLQPISGKDLAPTDILLVVDVSDRSSSLTGTTKKLAINQLSIGLGIDSLIARVNAIGITGLSLAPVGSTPNAYGSTLTGSTLTLQAADANYPGLTTTGNVVEVRSFGAVGNGIADDTVALQAAFDAAVTGNAVVALTAGASYKTTAELRLGRGLGAYCRLDGRGATIKCYAGTLGVGQARSILYIDSDVAIIRDLAVQNLGAVSNGFFYSNASTSVFENCGTYGTIVDGFASAFNSDRCILRNCTARVTGRIFHTSGYAGPSPQVIRTLVVGTVSKTSGTTCIITRDSGTVDFTTMGIRPRDMVSLHATSPGGKISDGVEWLQIASVDSATQITCKLHPASSGAATGLKFSIHVGDGYHEGPGRADNNIHRIDTFLGENTAGAGLSFGGLYGPRCDNLQVNAAGSFPIVIASVDLPCLGSGFKGVYFELCAAVDNFFFGGAAGVSVDTGNVAGAFKISSDGFNFGTMVNMQNQSDSGRIDPLGSVSVSYIPSAILGFNALTWEKLHGRSYLAYNQPGGGSIEIADNRVSTFELFSGCVWFGADANHAAYALDTDSALTNGSGNADLLTKHLLKLRNAGSFKFGIGVMGDIRTTSTDISGTPGAGTINSPSGRFALAAGQTTVIVTNALVKTGTKVMLSKLSLDTTAKDFMVAAGTGTFTVTSANAATAAVKFDFLLVNTSS